MARPLSDDKKEAILAAAAELVAMLGTSAPTAKIARAAGVAEGTLFTYFPDKDALLGQLFLDIEGELAAALLGDLPAGGAPGARARHIWNRFIDWGAANPIRRKALRQLKVSDRIGADCRRLGEKLFAGFRAVLEETLAGHVADGQSVDYAGAVFGALAETTLEFITREPARHEYHRALGFETFWKAIAR